MQMKITLALAFLGWSLAQAAAQHSDRIGDWPQWRGLNRDGLSRETGLRKAWPEGGPKLRWSTREVGIGYGLGCNLYQIERNAAGFAVSDDLHSAVCCDSRPFLARSASGAVGGK